MNKQLDEYMQERYDIQLCNTLEMALRIKFPNIQNLKVFKDDDGQGRISCDETEYSKEEIEAFLNELKKQ